MTDANNTMRVTLQRDDLGTCHNRTNATLEIDANEFRVISDGDVETFGRDNHTLVRPDI